MSDDALALVHGGGNEFRDLCMPDPEASQLKAKLATEIIKVLDERRLTVSGAHKLTGFAAADFSRAHQAKLRRFTVDRLLAMLDKLGQQVEVSVKVRPRAGEPPRDAPPAA